MLYIFLCRNREENHPNKRRSKETSHYAGGNQQGNRIIGPTRLRGIKQFYPPRYGKGVRTRTPQQKGTTTSKRYTRKKPRMDQAFRKSPTGSINTSGNHRPQRNTTWNSRT